MDLDEDTSGHRSKIDSFMIENFLSSCALLSSHRSAIFRTFFFFAPLWKLIIQMLSNVYIFRADFIQAIYKITIVIIFFLSTNFLIFFFLRKILLYL